MSTVWQGQMNSAKLREEIAKKKLDRWRSFVRNCFMKGGIISNPNHVYHIEFILDEETAIKLTKIFREKFELEPKTIARRGKFVVYFKGGDYIADVLKIMGANKALLQFEETRITKSVANSENRRNNFDVANIKKVTSAAVSQIDAIRHIDRVCGLSSLPASLEEVARLRLDDESLTLADIAKLLAISKSGVNHRLRKIVEIAKSIKADEHKNESRELND